MAKRTLVKTPATRPKSNVIITKLNMGGPRSGCESDEHDTEVNIVIMGDEESGKTSILERLSQDTFSSSYTKTVGVDCNSRILDVDGTHVKLNLCDTSGQQAFLWTAKKHLKECDGVVVCYDTTSQKSFESIPGWLELIQRSVKSRDLPKILLGTKLDLKHKKVIAASKAKEFAIPEGMEHVECSAQVNKNITVAFYLLSRLILRYRKMGCGTRLGAPQLPITCGEVHETAAEKLDGNDPEYTHLFKILMLGDTRVGKTSLRYRFSRDYYNTDYHATSGLEYSTRTLMVDDEKVKIQVWDVGGESVYDMTRKNYYRGANAFVIVYDITHEASFKKAEYLLKELDMYGQADCPKALVGNKGDMAHKRKVDVDEVKSFADGWRIPHLEASARTGSGADNAFLKITIALKRQLAPWKRVYKFD